MAPKGNKNALGNCGGRPRTASLSELDMVALGEEMIKFLEDNPDTLHLSQWYSIKKMYTYKQWKAMIQLSEFLPYYSKAISIIGVKYLDKRVPIRDTVAHRFLHCYFPEVKEAERETVQFEHDLKKEQSETVPVEIVNKFASLSQQLADMQKAYSDLNIADTNSKVAKIS